MVLGMTADFASIGHVSGQPRVAARQVRCEKKGRSNVSGLERIECVSSVRETRLDVLGNSRGGDSSSRPWLDAGDRKASRPKNAVAYEERAERTIPRQVNDIPKLEAPVHETPAPVCRMSDRRVE